MSGRNFASMEFSLQKSPKKKRIRARKLGYVESSTPSPDLKTKDEKCLNWR